jgi:hypothetical protein
LARKATSQNGHDRLEEAMTMLIQNQAAFLARVSETDRLTAEYRRQQLEIERETKERFARIEAQIGEVIRVLNDHTQILAEHTRILERLPDAVREKIAFKGP